MMLQGDSARLFDVGMAFRQISGTGNVCLFVLLVCFPERSVSFYFLTVI